jgi:hypothetical protein
LPDEEDEEEDDDEEEDLDVDFLFDPLVLLELVVLVVDDWVIVSNSSSFTEDAEDVDSPFGFPFETEDDDDDAAAVELDVPFDCELDGVLFCSFVALLVDVVVVDVVEVVEFAVLTLFKSYSRSDIRSFSNWFI